MFIDYLTLMMINLVAGTVLLAHYLWKGLDEKDQRPLRGSLLRYRVASLVTGLQLAFTWPLPGSYNIAYGDATTLFGVVFLWGVDRSLARLEPGACQYLCLLRGRRRHYYWLSDSLAQHGQGTARRCRRFHPGRLGAWAPSRSSRGSGTTRSCAGSRSWFC